MLAMISTRCSRSTGPQHRRQAGSHKASMPTTPPVGGSLLAMISTGCSRMTGPTASPASRLPQSQHAHHAPCGSELARDDIDRMFQDDRGHSIAGKPAPTGSGQSLLRLPEVRVRNQRLYRHRQVALPGIKRIPQVEHRPAWRVAFTVLIEQATAQHQIVRQPAFYQPLQANADAIAVAPRRLPQPFRQLVACPSPSDSS